METTLVFLDGGYLSEISKHFGEGKPLKIDLNQFAITLAKANNLWCKGVYYYTAPPYQNPIKPSSDESRRRKNYDRFTNKLRRIPHFILREGRCQKSEDYSQKGVDTLLTMDLCSLFNKNIKTIIVLACDTDFVPVLNELREKLSIKVILAYYSDFKRRSKFSMSNYILTACDEKFLITKEHLEKSKQQYYKDNKITQIKKQIIRKIGVNPGKDTNRSGKG